MQQGGQYQLHGTDDQCGALVQASAIGLAFQNANGSIGFGSTMVTAPGGTAVHVDATIAIAGLSGTWRDSAGNSGDFVFTPGSPVAGSPRPIPAGGVAPASITNVQVANNAVSGANIINGSITNVDILDGPRASIAGDDQIVVLTGTAQIVRSVTVAAPAAGRVILNTSGYFWFVSNATPEQARCTLTPGASIDLSALIIASETVNTPAALTFLPFAATRGFTVNAGSTTFNLVCDGAGTVAINDTQLNAIFVANTP